MVRNSDNIKYKTQNPCHENQSLKSTDLLQSKRLRKRLALRKRLKRRKEKYASTDTIIDLTEVVLKNKIFTFGKKTLKQKRGTAIGTKFAPPCSIYLW